MMRPHLADSTPGEGQRLTLALLLALTLHALLIFGIPFKLLSEPPGEPAVNVQLNLLEPAGDQPDPAAEVATSTDSLEPTGEEPALPVAVEAGPATPEPAEPTLPPAAEPSPPAAEPSPPVTSSEPVVAAPAPQTTLPWRHKVMPAPPVPRASLASGLTPSRAEKTIASTNPPPAPAGTSFSQTGKTAAKTNPSQSTPGRPAVGQTAPPRQLNSLELLNRGLEMARNDIAPESQTGNPWAKPGTPSALNTLKSFYEENWARKVERLGTIPEEAVRLKLTTGPTLDVAIQADGGVHSITVLRSSGHPAVDDAAHHMVEQAAPYAPFPPELRRHVTLLHIVRKWKFEHGRLLSE
jgi:protein TonB